MSNESAMTSSQPTSRTQDSSLRNTHGPKPRLPSGSGLRAWKRSLKSVRPPEPPVSARNVVARPTRRMISAAAIVQIAR